MEHRYQQWKKQQPHRRFFQARVPLQDILKCKKIDHQEQYCQKMIDPFSYHSSKAKNHHEKQRDEKGNVKNIQYQDVFGKQQSVNQNRQKK